MNAFKPYEDGKLKEDNVSRVLAIVLDENRLAFDRFTDLLNAKLLSEKQKLILKPSAKEDFSVDIQRNVSDIAEKPEGVSRIIPVTLTPETAPDEENYGGANTPVPDICIVFRDRENADLIIIETKVKSDYAVAQVKHQAESIKNAMNKSGSNVSVSPVIKLSWKEIVEILLGVYGFESERDIILGHYIEYLKRNYAGWFPVAPFSAGMSWDFLQGRLDVLANNCALLLNTLYDEKEEKFSVGSSYSGGRKISFTPSWGYAQEIHIVPERNDDGTLKGIAVNFWPGNNAGQGWQLFGDGSLAKEDMSWVENTEITTDNGTSLAMEASLYMKFADSFGRYVMESYPSFEHTERSKMQEEFAPFFGSWNRYHNNPKWNWESLKNLVRKYLSEEAAEAFEKNFEDSFENSNRTVVNFSVGFEISVKIPAEKLAKLDNQNQNFADNANAKDDGVATLVVSIIKALRDMIEK